MSTNLHEQENTGNTSGMQVKEKGKNRVEFFSVSEWNLRKILSFCFRFCFLTAFSVQISLGSDPPTAPVSVLDSLKTPAKEIPFLYTDWKAPGASEIRGELEKWCDSLGLSGDLREQVLENWPKSDDSFFLPPEMMSAKTVQSMKIASKTVAEFLDSCDSLEWNEVPFGQKLRVPSLPGELVDSGSVLAPKLFGTLRMYLIQRLIRAHYYDEALELLKEMELSNTIDPVAVLYCRGIASNALSKKEEGLRAMQELRECFSDSSKTSEGFFSDYSRRFGEIAKLLENELKSLGEEENQPSNIARKMGDVGRRLGLGQTDEKVQEVEKKILDSLEELIEKIEEQQKQCQKNCAGGQGKPGNESRIMRQKGPGDIAEKKIGEESGWGDLPPKEREAAMMQIEKDFPSHYREIIEQYFRQLANQE